jgi:hypothetical protein
MLNAQSTMEWEDFVQDMYEQYANQEVDDEGQEWEDGGLDAMLDELYEIHLSPINLNDLKSKESANDSQTYTTERLSQLPFLNRQQIEAIVYYVNVNYPVRSLGELMLIRELDYLTRLRLMLFCYAGEPSEEGTYSLRRLWRFAQHEVTARTDFPLYTKDGYRDKPQSVVEASPNKIYRGNSNYHSLRYQLRSMHRVTAGFQIEKDAGEDVMDYCAGYVMVNQIGNIRTLIVGDYKLGFGQGLVINNGMSFGKSSGWGLFSNTSVTHGIRKHSSMSEANHFRGAAIDYGLGENAHLTAFLSYRNVDGTLRTDNHNAISSLKTDGLHRTLLERSKKGIVGELSAGGNFGYFHKGWLLGLTGIVTHFSMPLAPKFNTPSTRYRRFYPQGTLFSALGASYSYRRDRWVVQGEYAFSTSNGVDDHSVLPSEVKHSHPNRGAAAVNSMRYKLNNYTYLSALVRYYDARYATIYSRAFGENSRPQNELGAFIGITAEPWTKVHLEAYMDCFQSPEQRYRAAAGAKGFESQIKMTYNPSDRTSWQIRYRLKSKQQDVKVRNDVTQLYYATRHDLRVQWNYRLHKQFLLKTTAAGVYYIHPSSSDEIGYLLTQHLRWERQMKRIHGKQRADFSITYFHTDSYASKVYTNEPSLLYTLGMTSLFYHGVKAIVLYSTNISSRLSLTCKISATKYFNRDTIGTGLEMINASHKEDIQLQLRWKL